MISKKKVIFVLYLLGICVVVLVGSLLITKKISYKNINPEVLGQKINTPTSTPTNIPTNTILPTQIPFSVIVQNAPTEVNEGGNATFTWYVNGPSQRIRTTTIYYGTTSDPQLFNTNLTPENSPYTHSLVDFTQGKYLIPLQFIAYAKDMRPGTYYYRGYALIAGKHYWTKENTFTVNEAPKHEIKIIDPLTNIHKGENITFTWEILGPPGVTNYTAIVAAKESKPGPLDESIDTTMTPYKNIVTEYTSGANNVPLRFIGNTSIQEEGTYYFRAVTKIDNKNIWSEEYTLKVE